MANTDIGAIANAWEKTVDAVMKIIGGAKGRRNRTALRSAQQGFKRALKSAPKLKKDKQFMSYKKSFEKNLI